MHIFWTDGASEQVCTEFETRSRVWRFSLDAKSGVYYDIGWRGGDKCKK
jgi:hypothetical protein